ncbi:hypothetical protein COCON_G00110570 [Conger conger]|uniref:Uncharacterized protein n=1 Tax=Conger conger TaxID=82655 RepID=A0A9Q1DKD4_CONCO|nr:hypothetical protein COCON_G00110570 [Conger conger]
MIIMANGLCLGMPLLCSVWALSVNMTDASAVYSFGSTQSGSHPSSYRPRKYHHPQSHTPHANGLDTIHLGNPRNGRSVTSPGKRGTVYIIGNHGLRRLIATLYKRVRFAHSFHRGSIYSVRNTFQGEGAINRSLSRNIENRKRYPPSAMNARHTGSAFGHFASGQSRPSGSDLKYLPFIISHSAIQMRPVLIGNAAGVDFPGPRATGMLNRGRIRTSHGHFGSEDRGTIPRNMPRRVVPAHSEIGHNEDHHAHSGNTYRQPVSAQSANEGNNYDHHNLAPNLFHPSTINFGSAHSEIGHSEDNHAHSGNAYRQPVSAQSANEGNNYDHHNLAPNLFHPSTINFGSAHSEIGHSEENHAHSGNAYRHPASAQSANEGNNYDHHNLAPNLFHPSTINFGSAHSEIGHSEENHAHSGNAYRQPVSAPSANEGNNYDHHNLAPNLFHPSTINFGSAHSEIGHSEENHAHSGNAYRQPVSAQSANEGNNYDHHNLAPNLFHPSTINFGSAHSEIGHSDNNHAHSGNTYSQPVSGQSTHEGNHYDHNYLAPNPIHPSTINFGSAHGYSGSPYSQSTHELNHYDHNSFAPNVIHPPTTNFGSNPTVGIPSVDISEHIGNAYGQYGSAQSTHEQNHYDHNNLAPNVIHPSTIHFGSAHSEIGHSEHHQAHRENTYHQPVSEQTTSERDHYDHDGSLHVQNSPSKISLVDIYFGSSNGHHLAGPSQSGSNLGNLDRPSLYTIHYGYHHSGTTPNEGDSLASTRAPRIYEVIGLGPALARTFVPNALNTDNNRIPPAAHIEASIFLGKRLPRLFQSPLQQQVIGYDFPHPQDPSPGKCVHHNHIHTMKSSSFKPSSEPHTGVCAFI